MDGHNIPLKDNLSIFRVSLVIIRQMSDGYFRRDKPARKLAIECKSPLR
jgi:hypothetical protein